MEKVLNKIGFDKEFAINANKSLIFNISSYNSSQYVLLPASKFQEETNFSNLENYTLNNYTYLLRKLEKIVENIYGHDFDIIGRKKTEVFSFNNIVSSDDVKNEIPDDENETIEDYDRFVSDIWIGVVLTLLIVSIIFFICFCFLYHKFQQWKNSCRNNATNVQPDMQVHYELDVESLPSYTICSGLPTYDAALEELKKIETRVITAVEIFEKSHKHIRIDSPLYLLSQLHGSNNSLSGKNSCICGGNSTNNVSAITTTPLSHSKILSTSIQKSNSIESLAGLTPKQLKNLSEKRLSLEISFSSRRIPSITEPNISSIPSNLMHEVSRNNFLRSNSQLNHSDMLGYDRTSMRLNFDIAQKITKNFDKHRGSLT